MESTWHLRTSSAPALRPTGTVTFLFTDIEGSTQRWDRDIVAMQGAMRRHDAIVRRALEEQQGYIFNTVGDGFCTVFARAPDAVAAALAVHEALGTEDFTAVGGLRLRIAIHTGHTDEREGDYFGPAVNRVARLIAVASGGQILLSGVASDLVVGSLPPQVALQDLGSHRLKDLARPEQIYQLLAPNLPRDFPPLRSLETLPNNLPLQLTSFVAREREIAEITALLERHRLVTLAGSGGVGKTRTSLQVGAHLVDGAGNGVWFVELAPLTDGSLIPSTIAAAMRVQLPPDSEPLAALVKELASKRLLLILDNCEHLVDAAAAVAAALLRGCPNVKILASSRQGLGIVGEETYRMPSLAFPAEAELAALTAEEALRCGAIALFVERATSVDKRFTLVDANAPTVAEICRRLDGIALAIELAAARVKILSPKQLRQRLDERFRVLTGGNRDTLPRQQTLRALIDWSYDLLDERERSLFRRVGIFVDGFTLEAASAVCSDATLDESDVFDVLFSLIDKSLVVAEPFGETTRYRLLESTRAYALEKLDAKGRRAYFAGRHLTYFCDVLERARVERERTGINVPIVAFAPELENVRAALAWSLRGGDAATGAKLFSSAGILLMAFGLHAEGLDWAERFVAVLADRDADAPLLARLWYVLAVAAGVTYRSARAFEAAERAVFYARSMQDRMLLAHVLVEYAYSATNIRRADLAQAALDEAQTLSGAGATPRQQIRLLQASAKLALLRGDLDAAATAYEKLRALYRTHGDELWEAITAGVSLAETAHARGDTTRAIALAREALPVFVRMRIDTRRAVLLSNLTGYLAAVDDRAGAREAARQAIPLMDPASPKIAFTLEHVALIDALEGEMVRPALLLGYCAATLRASGYEKKAKEQTTYARLIALLRAHHSEQELARLMAEGAALAPQQAVDLAMQA